MILDPTCGSRMFWFDHDNPDVIFGDIRSESHILCDGRSLVIRPDVRMSFTALPFSTGLFDMVVFDPPHLNNVGHTSWTFKKYGKLKGDWRSDLACGFSECLRVLKCGGTLVFKWNETQIKVSEIIPLSGIPPLFGNRSGKASNTHWLCFMKPIEVIQ